MAHRSDACLCAVINIALQKQNKMGIGVLCRVVACTEEYVYLYSPGSPLQGEWKPRQIDNPDYKGTWIHPEIDNPEYFPDANIYAYDSFGVLGLDLWQVRHRKDKDCWQTSSCRIILVVLEERTNLKVSRHQSGTFYETFLVILFSS